MSYMIVPAQKEAEYYLEQAMRWSKKPFRIGGHSKGGNLAVYAGVMCWDVLKPQMIAIYNNDGPGLSKELVASDKYAEVRHLIRRIVPEYCVIGMLFEHDSACEIVQSTEKGIMQHDCESWIVSGTSFTESRKLDKKAIFLNKILGDWICRMEPGQRQRFVSSLFSAFKCNNLKSASEFPEISVKKIIKIIGTLNPLGKNTRTIIYALIKSIGHTARSDFNAQRGQLSKQRNLT